MTQSTWRLAATVLFLTGCMTMMTTGCAKPRTPSDEARLQAVVAHADNVLERGRDRWSGEATPLFADGIDPRTGEPAVWRYKGKQYVISNLASQQNLLRTLDALSNATGDGRYRRAAEAAVRYHFDHLASSCGLLRWGGHNFIDLATLEQVGDFDCWQHEFKNHFPYYELMWRVDRDKTTRFMRAFWNAHIMDWSRLDMSRHGAFDKEMGPLWDHEFDEPEPFFEGRGLTFLNAGTDLIYAGAMLYGFTGEEGARVWAERLARQYVRARHPETGLGAFQYSKPTRRKTPVIPMTCDRDTWGEYGDRAENQFGDQYADVYGGEFRDVAREGWAIWGYYRNIYAVNGLIQLTLAERLGDQGRCYLDWTVSGLKALMEHGYDAEANHFRPMWADGTDLTGRFITNYGYYNQSQDPRPFEPTPADFSFLVTCAKAYRLTRDPELWGYVRDLTRGNGLGDLGAEPGDDMALNLETGVADPEAVFAALEIYRIVPEPEILELARRLGDNLVAQRFHHGFFMPSAAHRYAQFNTLEPLAILALDAVIRGRPQDAPPYVASRGYIHGKFDGHGRTYDLRAIWPQLVAEH